MEADPVTSQSLAKKRILVVEDEFFLADDLCRDLEGMGAVVVGPAPSVERALALMAATPCLDAAVLDVNLCGEVAYPVADGLMARSVPFVFASGYDDRALDERYPEIPRCRKPTEFRVIAQVLEKALAG